MLRFMRRCVSRIERWNMPDSQPPTETNVTTLLVRAQTGDRVATQELFPLVYEELRTLAARYLSHESAAQTLQRTALVHEAFLRLVGPADSSWENRRHFFGAAAKAMRRILMDHSRAKRRMKRGGGKKAVSLEDTGLDLQMPAEAGDLMALDETLERLGQEDPAKVQLVELRYFAGLSMEEISGIL